MPTKVRGSAFGAPNSGSAPVPPSPVDPSVRPLPRPTGGDYPALAGREQELAWLKTAWREAVKGRGRVMLAAGEPGVGKTRLAEELARRVSSHRSWVLPGNCETIASGPYRPLLGALRDSIPALPANMLGVDGGTGADLIHLLSGGGDHAGPPVGGDGDPSAARRRVLDGLCGLIRRLAAEAPVLLVLDDLEQADRSTLVAVRHLCRAAPGLRVLVFGTYCEAAVDRADPLFDLLGDLRSAGASEQRVLGALDAGQVTAVVGDAVLGRELWRASEGNPLCVQLLLHELHDDGYLSEGGRLCRPLSPGWSGPRIGVDAAVDRRLARLDAATSRVLGAASVVGPEFDLYLVASTLRLGVDRVQRAVRRAEDGGIVRPAPARPDTYRFTSATFRHRLYGGLAPNQRVRLHGRVAAALELRPSTDADDQARLAFHLERSSPVGHSEKLLRHSSRVGDHAMAVGGYEDAAEHYGRALGATELSAPQRADVLVSLADAHWRSGDSLRARTASLEAAAAARTLNDGERLGQAALALARVAPVWGRDDVLARLLKEAQVLMDGRGPVAAAVRSRLEQLR